MADDIAQWLEGLGFGQYAQAFAENDIDLEILPRLSEEDLEKLGLSMGHRRMLQSAIEALSIRYLTNTRDIPLVYSVAAQS